MGLRIACYICQRITNALMFMYRRLSFEGVNYLDDLGAVETRDKAWTAFATLGKLLKDLGVWEALSKAAEPSTFMTFLGVRCDSEKFLLSITEERLSEITQLVTGWLDKETAFLRETQSLAGKLNFVCSTVRAGRVFVSRILTFLRGFNGQMGQQKVSEELRADLLWWRKFLGEYNWVTMFPNLRWTKPDEIVSTDSCLTGCGGWANGDYFHCKFPGFVLNQELTINELECLAVVMAIKLCHGKLLNRNVLMYCDNASTVQVVNKGNAKHPFTQRCLRELVWITARHNIWVKMCFVAGVDNRLSDYLSCFHLHKWFRAAFYEETKHSR